MTDEEIRELMSDEKRVEKLQKKLRRLFTGISDYADQELMGWTADELLVMQEYFGDVLLYDVNRNLQKTLEGAHGNDTIH